MARKIEGITPGVPYQVEGHKGLYTADEPIEKDGIIIGWKMHDQDQRSCAFRLEQIGLPGGRANVR